jgi:enterochelin esterase-like enzyme
VQRQYGGAVQPDRIAFGGSSFGGICTLWASMHYGDRFGAALVESPSLWCADEKFLRWVWKLRGLRSGDSVA